MSRIYVIHDQRGSGPGDQRLVRAGTRAQALRHVAQDVFAVNIASQDALVRLLSSGASVEDAGAESEEAAA
jgi:hypothetical protein